MEGKVCPSKEEFRRKEVAEVKIVVVKSPKALRGILKSIFKVK